jgi:predicted membrane chloride channel (bestrophin family)
MDERLFAVTNAQYDQFDSTVREMWKLLDDEQRLQLRTVVQELRDTKDPLHQLAAVFLSWATCTLTKREADDKYEAEHGGT